MKSGMHGFSAQPVWTDTQNECPGTESPFEETQHICNFLMCLKRRMLGKKELGLYKKRSPLAWYLNFPNYLLFKKDVQVYIGAFWGENLFCFSSSIATLDLRFLGSYRVDHGGLFLLTVGFWKDSCCFYSHLFHTTLLLL